MGAGQLVGKLMSKLRGTCTVGGGVEGGGDGGSFLSMFSSACKMRREVGFE